MDKYIYLSIGTNKGDRISNSKLVIKKISNISNIIKISNFYKTQSWGFSADYFLNFIIQIQTKLLPIDLLDELIKIEKQMGRYRKPHLNENKYVSRIIDIDILFYGSEIINSNKLIIPHPRINLRNFILIPLSELCPNFICPVTNKKIKDILKDCQDKSIVKKTTTIIHV